MAARASGNLQVGIMVAHPDDETLWVGGSVLLHPEWQCCIWTLCRASDPDRAPKYRQALERLGATGAMADLDDSPAQTPLPEGAVEAAIAGLIGQCAYDLLITHAPMGEYTRHRRHEETGKAVMGLWQRGALSARELWLFAYEDGGRAYEPRAREDADVTVALPAEIWQVKYCIIHELYGFSDESWEARITPRVEAFWRFTTLNALYFWHASLRE